MTCQPLHIRGVVFVVAFAVDRGLRMSKLRRVEELFASRHSNLNDLEVLACQRGVAFSYLDIGMANYFRG